MVNERLFVEQRPEGDYAVRKPNSGRASAGITHPGGSHRESEGVEPQCRSAGRTCPSYLCWKTRSVAQALTSQGGTSMKCLLDCYHQNTIFLSGP